LLYSHTVEIGVSVNSVVTDLKIL